LLWSAGLVVPRMQCMARGSLLSGLCEPDRHSRGNPSRLVSSRHARAHAHRGPKSRYEDSLFSSHFASPCFSSHAAHHASGGGRRGNRSRSVVLLGREVGFFVSA
jgi:hypothetical protein